MVSEEFARQANLAGEPCQKDIETAAAAGKMQIIGRCYPIRLRIAGIGTPFEIQPWIVRGMKNAVNLGQLFLSRNNAHLTFMEGKVSLQIGGGEVYLEEKGYSGIDGRVDEVPAAAGSWERAWTALLSHRERERLLGRQPRVVICPLEEASRHRHPETERGSHLGGRPGEGPQTGMATGQEEPWTEIHPRWKEPPLGGGRAAGGDKESGATGGSGPRA